jgi:DNA-binding HxlR family transcriptional regulator
MMDGDCQTFVSDCHVRLGAELVSHTWDPVVRPGPARRNSLLAGIGGVSDKALTESLRRLRARGLVTTTAGPGAVYRLSPLGESLAGGPLLHLARWAADHQAELA